MSQISSILEQLTATTPAPRTVGADGHLIKVAKRNQETLRRAIEGTPAPAPLVNAPVSNIPSQPARTIAELNVQLSAVPVGRYALPRADRSGVDFFQVKNIGRDRYLLVRLVGSPGDLRQVTLPVRLQSLAAIHIMEDHKSAAQLFGRALGTCGYCNTALTDPKSIARGVGPCCAKKRGI